MYGNLYALLVLLLIAYIGHWYHTAGARKRALQKLQQKPSFRSVSIVAGENACEAVRKLRGVRFLCKEAPLVPLADCDARCCECHYRHFSDRRQEDRRDLYGRHITTYLGQERRTRKRDRRRDYAPTIRMVSRG